MWYLGLPIDSAGRTTGTSASIYNPTLATYENAPYFTQDSTGCTFRAPCGGATTSGSSYPRSELRETLSDGRTLASWSSSTGINTMHITEQVNHLPVVKPQVVCGQIHDSSDDVIEILADGTDNPTNPKINVRFQGKSQPAPVIASVALGTPFDIQITAKGGQITIYGNGVLTHTFSYSRSGLYFKDGCYTQSNVAHGDAPDAYGEVKVTALTVSHT